MGLMMRASSPENEALERTHCAIDRHPHIPPKVPEIRPQCCSTPDVDTSNLDLSSTCESKSSPILTSTPENAENKANVSSPSTNSNPKLSGRPCGIAKSRHQFRSKSRFKAHRPSFKAHKRFTSLNIAKARDLAAMIEDYNEYSRSQDLEFGRERSELYWFCKRALEPQPNEMLRKLRRLQFEAAKREMLADGMKSWEISALCLEGASGLRREVRVEEMSLTGC